MRNIAAVIGLGAFAALAGPVAAVSGDRLHGEPPSTNYTLSYDGSKMIVLHRRDRRKVLDVIDARSGESLGLSGRSFASMRWGEDSDTAYALARKGGIQRLSFTGDGVEATPIALTGEHGIPKSEKPRVLAFPTPVTSTFLAQAGGRAYRCALVPAAGGEEIAAHCEVAHEDIGKVRLWLIDANGQFAARIVRASTGENEFQSLAEDGTSRAVFRYLPHYTRVKTLGGVQRDNTIWALSNRNRAQVALVRLDVATGREVVVHERPGIDVDDAGILFDGTGQGSPLLATHFPGYQEVVHFEPRLEAAYAALRKSLGEPVRIDFKSADRALNFAVVEARSPSIYRRWYLLDLEAQTFRELSAGTLANYDRRAEPSRPVSFPASDGLTLHGYLTLPKLPVDAGPPPMALMLHGGPWGRDRWPGTWFDRFLGSRGYVVLRLNYRGSTGYGRDFLEAGKGTMFARLQQDVLDAARWAVDGGHAAEGRIALLGGSFGGFLVLTTLVRHPEAFRAGVAVNGITDMVTFWKPNGSVAVIASCGRSSCRAATCPRRHWPGPLRSTMSASSMRRSCCSSELGTGGFRRSTASNCSTSCARRASRRNSSSTGAGGTIFSARAGIFASMLPAYSPNSSTSISRWIVGRKVHGRGLLSAGFPLPPRSPCAGFPSCPYSPFRPARAGSAPPSGQRLLHIRPAGDGSSRGSWCKRE